MKTLKALILTASFVAITGLSIAQTTAEHVPVEKTRSDDLGDRLQPKHTGKYDFVDVDQDSGNNSNVEWYVYFISRMNWLFF
jgi:hypothetical protein